LENLFNPILKSPPAVGRCVIKRAGSSFSELSLGGSLRPITAKILLEFIRFTITTDLVKIKILLLYNTGTNEFSA
jgi:hypothetical protein